MDRKDFSLIASVVVKSLQFSFDEIVLLIEEKISAGGAKLLAEELFNFLSLKICDSYSETVLPKIEKSCCDTPYWLHHGKTQKTMNSSLGKLRLSPHRMKCHNCHTTHNPFNLFFDLKTRRNTYELEHKALSMITDQSYRRTSKHLALVSNIDLSKNQIQRAGISTGRRK